MKNKYYAYFLLGGQRGICEDWKECEKKVKGVASARFQSFKTRGGAEEWLKSGAKYEIRIKKQAEPGIYFDAGTGRGRGVEISVTDENGKDLLDKVLPHKKLNKFHKHLVKGKDITNNYGELLACNYALRLALKSGTKKVFGDSKLVIDFWSQGILRRKLLPKKTIKLAEEVFKLRRKFENNGGAIERVSGDDNPADLGFH
ncbi:MAG: ribonuclease H family protein [Candidatus Harrisonbacteria bacterium]|nr:ribonuclease H family protein [Candidatus Harrisonbacteria bacterium]